MKRAFLALLLLLPTTALADDRAEKRQLIAELLEVIDAKVLLQKSFESLLGQMGGVDEFAPENVPEEDREAWETARRREEEKVRALRDRLFARVDHAKYFEEVYVPILDKQFTSDELRQLIDVFKTKHGQKLASVLPDFGILSAQKGMAFLHEAAAEVREEIEKEEAAKYPWRTTMMDMRALATAVEARATDTEDYPSVSFDELEALLLPTYLARMPKVDAWGTPFLFIAYGKHYRLVSAGADKTFEWNARRIDPSATTKISDDLDTDIIFQNGDFIQLPKEAADQR